MYSRTHWVFSWCQMLLWWPLSPTTYHNVCALHNTCMSVCRNPLKEVLFTGHQTGQTTVKAPCNWVYYNMITNMIRQWQMEVLYQTMDSQKTTPYLALTGELWGAFCEYLETNTSVLRRSNCSTSTTSSEGATAPGVPHSMYLFTFILLFVDWCDVEGFLSFNVRSLNSCKMK